MSSYKNLFYKSQAEIADAIDDIEKILESLKKCMSEFEECVMSEETSIVYINNTKQEK